MVRVREIARIQTAKHTLYAPQRMMNPLSIRAGFDLEQ
jgi:hypothetical protein